MRVKLSRASITIWSVPYTASLMAAMGGGDWEEEQQQQKEEETVHWQGQDQMQQ
jgi:hypothetical protein